MNIVSSIIDHLVAALAGDPSCSLRRALVLVDIDANPGTNQAEIMERIDIDKSSLNRDIEWLFDYGCIRRLPGGQDARTKHLETSGCFSRKHLLDALKLTESSHESLKNFLITFINEFSPHKLSLRDAKVISVIGERGEADKRDILNGLYDTPGSTADRTIKNLLFGGLIEKSED